jgi:hypothetical protein
MNFMGRDATEEFEMLHDDEVSFYHFTNLELLYLFHHFPSTPQTLPHQRTLLISLKLGDPKIRTKPGNWTC